MHRARAGRTHRRAHPDRARQAGGRRELGGAPRFIDQLTRARDRGIPIDCDHYPYTTALNPIRNLLPASIQQGGVERMLQRLGDRVMRIFVLAFSRSTRLIFTLLQKGN
jgi:N-acyl-D-aspartate/D-glutamate deacylase